MVFQKSEVLKNDRFISDLPIKTNFEKLQFMQSASQINQIFKNGLYLIFTPIIQDFEKWFIFVMYCQFFGILKKC